MGAAPAVCRCCGRTLDEETGGSRRGVCTGCAGTRPLTADAVGAPPTRVRDPRPGPEEAAPACTLPAPGTLVGSLVVEESLGEGGMGQVLVARDPELDRRVALKFLRAGLLGNERAERFFRREGRTLAGISHPHVVRVWSVGSWNGWPFLVMELVEGRPLADRTRRGPLPPGDALRIAEELASALAAVHAAGVIHRDVNPNNVILRDVDGTVCLIDFGLARTLARTTDSSGAVAGTPHYMAPEQISRQGQDHRVDIYSFGVTLFEMLTGSVPHEEVEGAAFFQAVLREDPPLLGTLLPGVPRALEVLAARALARAPELRFADGEALLAAVTAVRRAIAGGEAVAGTAASPVPAGPAAAVSVPRDPAESLPLLGRTAEYAAALRALEEVGNWRGRLVLVEGEDGSGKSRFLREIVRAARTRALGVMHCDGAEYAGSPYRALRTALADYASSLGATTPRDVLELAMAASPANRPLAPALRWFLLPRQEKGPAQPGRTELEQAVLVLLRALVRERPVLLVARDAQDLDAGSLDLLVAAAEQGAGWPLGLVLSYRPSEAARRRAPLSTALPRLRGIPGAVILPLGPLSESDVATMIHLGLHLDEAESRRVAAVLHRRSSGNPLHLVEALRLLRQEGWVGVEEGRRRIRERLTGLAIPPRLLELAARRILGLPRREKDALGIVSVDPAGVPSRLVARCLGLPRLQSLQVLQQLVRGRELLRQDGDRYWIPHGALREAVYGDLIPELRTEYHAEAAREFGEAGAAREDPERLGIHLHRAGRPAEAMPLLLEAGRHQLLCHSPGEALERFAWALECAGPAGCPAAEVGRAQALEQLGELDEARSILERCLRSGGEAAAEALLPLAEFERNRGRHREVLALLEKGESLPIPPEGRLRLLLLRAQSLSREGRLEEALQVLERAGARSGGASRVRVLELWNTQGTVRWRLGRFAEARACFEKALPLAEEVGYLDRSATLFHNMGLVASDLGRSAEAMEWMEKAVERALLVGNRLVLQRSRILRAALLVSELRLEEASAALDEVEPGLAGLDSMDASFLYLSCRAEIEIARGRPREALPWIAKCLPIAGGHARQAAEFRALRARALIECGLREEALGEAREVLAGPPPEGMEILAEEMLAVAARALRETGREGPEREALRALAAPRTPEAASERALEAPDPAERDRLVAEARRLAADPRARAALERRLG